MSYIWSAPQYLVACCLVEAAIPLWDYTTAIISCWLSRGAANEVASILNLWTAVCIASSTWFLYNPIPPSCRPSMILFWLAWLTCWLTYWLADLLSDWPFDWLLWTLCRHTLFVLKYGYFNSIIVETMSQSWCDFIVFKRNWPFQSIWTVRCLYQQRFIPAFMTACAKDSQTHPRLKVFYLCVMCVCYCLV